MFGAVVLITRITVVLILVLYVFGYFTRHVSKAVMPPGHFVEGRVPRVGPVLDGHVFAQGHDGEVIDLPIDQGFERREDGLFKEPMDAPVFDCGSEVSLYVGSQSDEPEGDF
jgi:hypothetical protein